MRARISLACQSRCMGRPRSGMRALASTRQTRYNAGRGVMRCALAWPSIRDGPGCHDGRRPPCPRACDRHSGIEDDTMALDIEENLAIGVPAGSPSNVIQIPIITERLVVRKFEPDDLDPFLSFMLKPESAGYLAFNPSHWPRSSTPSRSTTPVLTDPAMCSENTVLLQIPLSAEKEKFNGERHV